MGRGGRILAEGEMCSSLVVIIGVGVEYPTQVGFAERSRLPADAKEPDVWGPASSFCFCRSGKHNAGTPRRACSSAQGTSFRGPQTWVHCDLTNGTSCPARSGRRTATRMIAALGERAHDMAAEEARAAEDGDERIGGNCVIPRSWGWAPAGSTLICCAPASREYGSTQPRNIRRTRFLALTRSRGTRMNATAYICGQTNVRIPE